MTPDWEDAMHDLEAAEDFFALFGVDFDPAVVRVNRLHILQRFHDRLATAAMPADAAAGFALHAELLAAAYHDFVVSTPKKEKIFRVFQSLPDEPAFVPLAALAPRHEP
ncbi:nitrogenase-stabilizing/protective protein NifW [Oleispirillum naphthae]|uniref:nitrogenase-stabilizing/protective protein NifW n=1 Tax=Oleispirillum naphthae TaxID=2838853 RepID=UPI0030822A53